MFWYCCWSCSSDGAKWGNNIYVWCKTQCVVWCTISFSSTFRKQQKQAMLRQLKKTANRREFMYKLWLTNTNPPKSSNGLQDLPLQRWIERLLLFEFTVNNIFSSFFSRALCLTPSLYLALFSVWYLADDGDDYSRWLCVRMRICKAAVNLCIFLSFQI